jgi:hypothetical protein
VLTAINFDVRIERFKLSRLNSNEISPNSGAVSFWIPQRRRYHKVVVRNSKMVMLMSEESTSST